MAFAKVHLDWQLKNGEKFCFLMGQLHNNLYLTSVLSEDQLIMKIAKLQIAKHPPSIMVWGDTCNWYHWSKFSEQGI